MKAILKYPLYRRPQPTNEVEAVNYLPQGSVIDVEEIVGGKAIDGISSWYKATDGFYYWGGGLRELDWNSRQTDYRKAILNIPAQWMSTKGKNIKVAVLDTGFYLDHRDLNHLKLNSTIKDFGQNGNSADNVGHGTHITGILAATSSFEDGIMGLIPDARFFLYKVIKDDVGFLEQFAEAAILDAIDQQADIINMSFNIPSAEDSPLHKAINKAIAKNILVVASAGENDNLIQNSLVFPAQFENVVSVGEASKEFAGAINVNFNNQLDFIMPFVEQRSCWINNSGGLYHNLKGSSMATAMVTGILAAAMSFKNRASNPLVELKDIAVKFSNSVFNDSVLKIIKP